MRLRIPWDYWNLLWALWRVLHPYQWSMNELWNYWTSSCPRSSWFLNTTQGFRDNYRRRCNGPFVPFATPVGGVDVDYEANEDDEVEEVMEGEAIVVFDGVECYEDTPPRHTSIIGYKQSTFNPHTRITIIYGGAPPNVEEWRITHGVLFFIGLGKDTTAFLNPSLIHLSLCPLPATSNSDSDASDYDACGHYGVVISRRAFNLAGPPAQNAGRIRRECSSVIKLGNIC